MGERISIQFVKSQLIEGVDIIPQNPDPEWRYKPRMSVVFFDHWGGPDNLLEDAFRFIQELNAEAETEEHYGTWPLDRREPEVLLVEFIRWRAILHGYIDQRLRSSWYLGATPNDGDNSDWGHHQIDVETGRAVASGGNALWQYLEPIRTGDADIEDLPF